MAPEVCRTSRLAPDAAVVVVVTPDGPDQPPRCTLCQGSKAIQTLGLRSLGQFSDHITEKEETIMKQHSSVIQRTSLSAGGGGIDQGEAHHGHL